MASLTYSCHFSADGKSSEQDQASKLHNSRINCPGLFASTEAQRKEMDARRGACSQAARPPLAVYSAATLIFFKSKICLRRDPKKNLDKMCAFLVFGHIFTISCQIFNIFAEILEFFTLIKPQIQTHTNVIVFIVQLCFYRRDTFGQCLQYFI